VADRAVPGGARSRPAVAGRVPRRILLIVTRRIGDVLLVTPLLRSLRLAYPRAALEVLVFRGTGAVLQGNPDVTRVIEIPERSRPWDGVGQALRLLRRYDLALSALAGDRPHYLAFVAAPRRVSVVPAEAGRYAWKRWLAEAWTELDDTDTHTVEQGLRLADLLGIERSWDLVPPADPGAAVLLRDRLTFPAETTPFAVVHPTPKWRYKRWGVGGWQRLMQFLRDRGLELVVTGGPAPEEARYLAGVLEGAPPATVNLAGALTLAQTAELLRRARLFAGPDTAVTHMAAACGIPTLALYGPTNPVKWSPWPRGYAARTPPFRRRAALQVVGNVALVQGPGECVPCHQEGCDRHRESRSRCLDELSPDAVIGAAELLLQPPRAGRPAGPGARP
jgi:heptosyltransferase-3